MLSADTKIFRAAVKVIVEQASKDINKGLSSETFSIPKMFEANIVKWRVELFRSTNSEVGIFGKYPSIQQLEVVKTD
jgi:hypothetical protein